MVPGRMWIDILTKLMGWWFMFDMFIYIFLYMYDSVVNLGGILVRRERWVSDGVIVGESESVSQYVQDTLYANTPNWMLYQPIINTIWYPYQLMPRNCCWWTLGLKSICQIDQPIVWVALQLVTDRDLQPSDWFSYWTGKKSRFPKTGRVGFSVSWGCWPTCGIFNMIHIDASKREIESSEKSLWGAQALPDPKVYG